MFQVNKKNRYLYIVYNKVWQFNISNEEHLNLKFLVPALE